MSLALKSLLDMREEGEKEIKWMGIGIGGSDGAMEGMGKGHVLSGLGHLLMFE